MTFKEDANKQSLVNQCNPAWVGRGEPYTKHNIQIVSEAPDALNQWVTGHAGCWCWLYEMIYYCMIL